MFFFDGDGGSCSASGSCSAHSDDQAPAAAPAEGGDMAAPAEGGEMPAEGGEAAAE